MQYAGSLELKTAARPYIRPALDVNQQRFLEKRLKVLPFIVGS
jgi:hypothetical protein